LRVVINAQLDPERSGGIAQVILGLAHSLGKLSGREEYVFVCSPSSAPWLEPYIGPNATIEVNAKKDAPPTTGVRRSDGFWESFAPDVLHFPYQTYTRTDIPSVFNPHDLQHLHLPELFTDAERARRENLFEQACRLAAAVVTASRFVKDDILAHCPVRAEKVHVIGWAPPSAAYERPPHETVDRVLRKHDLPDGFAIYPAQTWPHKNHRRLLEALHLLRERHQAVIPLVCTGSTTEHFSELARLADRLGLNEQVRWLGWVDATDLMALYHAARMMIVPTRFEAVSFPIFEAFLAGIPVACSAVTSLPEQVGDAAILFDPLDVENMASAISRLYKDGELRRTLATRGRDRLAQTSWTDVAEQYRAVYRQVAGSRDRSFIGSRVPASTHGG
jgi:glycosyltransferase involved in cell wall biosynthesis